MPTRPKTSIDARLQRISISINNLKAHEQAMRYLHAYNIDSEKLAVGRRLCDEAIRAHTSQRILRGESEGATAVRDIAWSTAKRSHSQIITIARVALRGQASSALGLQVARSRALSAWITQAQQLHTGLEQHPEHMARLAEFGITAQRIAAARADLDALRAASAAQHQAAIQAQLATAQRNAALGALDLWMSQLLAVASVAFAEDPQLMELLGVTVR
ncbi:hypothetical protein F8S13_25550 [Chloroflexia bacterium SDU3-3]|nr:hypothetical protein F8S13_25550 [Chloroflexia bacterium SDU3-3]